MQKSKFLPLLFFFAFGSCNTSYIIRSLQYNDYRVSNNVAADKKLADLIKPYADSLNKRMNDVIGVAAITMETGLAGGVLGNLLADILLEAASRSYNTSVNAAILNTGGIRIPSIAAGNITVGKIFELLPFDNIIVLQKLTGKQLQSFLDHTTLFKGWPVAGITMQIKNKQAINVKVNNVPIDSNVIYTIALPDYVANGGDDASMLRNIPQQSNGYVFRDAVIEYVKKMTRLGLKISSKIENRVTYAE